MKDKHGRLTSTFKIKHRAYNRAIADALVDAIAESDHGSVDIILKEDAAFSKLDITALTIRRWADEHVDFKRDIQRARQVMLERRLYAHDKATEEFIDKIAKGDPKTAIALSSMYRIKSDFLKWSASRIHPEQFGDRLNVNTNNRLPTNVFIQPMVITSQKQAEAIGNVNQKALSQQPKITDGVLQDKRETYKINKVIKNIKKDKRVIQQ
jgi:hypothetical protein